MLVVAKGVIGAETLEEEVAEKREVFPDPKDIVNDWRRLVMLDMMLQ